MTSLDIKQEDIPRLEGKVVVISGGASGIGLAAAKIFAGAGAKTFLLDRGPPEDGEAPRDSTFIHADVTSWIELKAAFAEVGHVDIAVANAGVSEEQPYFEDSFDEQGELKEPGFAVVDVNFKGTVMFTKLAVSYMRRQGKGGSIVITTSATGYAPEQNLPVYSATKSGLAGLIRSLRSTLPRFNISINAVAPAATVTKLLPMDIATPLMAAGLPVSSAHMVGLAVVYSAVASQPRMVETYGKEQILEVAGKWNGRTILTLGENYTELEEKLADLRPVWFGWQNADLTKKQQATADFRERSTCS
jgi:NAD(P)-dependent dehydrogenase (short-subunit alcohol dehydrogenase family)